MIELQHYRIFDRGTSNKPLLLKSLGILIEDKGNTCDLKRYNKVIRLNLITSKIIINALLLSNSDIECQKYLNKNTKIR